MKIIHRFLSLSVVFFLLTAVSGSILAEDIGRPFNDVTKNAWYYNDVYGSYENGLFAGTSENTFSPDTTMSRAMIVTVLSAPGRNKRRNGKNPVRLLRILQRSGRCETDQRRNVCRQHRCIRLGGRRYGMVH